VIGGGHGRRIVLAGGAATGETGEMIMRSLRPIVAAGLFWTATGAFGQAPVPPDDAAIERFMKVLPDAETLDDEQAPDPDELARLRAINPGREAQVEAIMTTHSRCQSTLVNAKTAEMLRGIARDLGQEKVERLIAFYEGPDSPRVDYLFGRIENGEELSSAEQAEVDGLLARYPIEEMLDALDALKLKIAKDRVFLDQLAACEGEDGQHGSGEPDPRLSRQVTDRGWRGRPSGHSNAARSQPPRSAADA
jgi:hypothetical protein